MIYYGDSLSPNLTETSEGYLIALNVPIARTGIQKYLPAEVPVEDVENYVDADGMISVYREPEEVFSLETIASFQGKPICEGHPQPGSGEGVVDISNESFYRKGHMENVRRGTRDNTDNLVADLFLTDPLLISSVKSKNRREVSCGYLCDWVPENGKIYQRNIRGNHIAVVPKGRAGSNVAIKDEAPPSAGERRKHMAKETLKQRIFGLGLKEYAKDAEPEELAEAAKLGEAKEPETKDETPIEGASGGLEAKIDKLIEIVGSLVKSDKEVHTELPADAMSALDAEIEEEAKKEDEPEKQEEKEKSSTIGDVSTGTATGDSAMVDFVKRMKPIVAKMPVGAARDEAATELLNILKDGKKGSVYGQIAAAVQSHKGHDEAPKAQTTAEKTATFAENCKALREKEGK